jgi:hypothetical protein
MNLILFLAASLVVIVTLRGCIRRYRLLLGGWLTGGVL